jgi:hypothetical protein
MTKQQKRAIRELTADAALSLVWFKTQILGASADIEDFAFDAEMYRQKLQEIERIVRGGSSA